MVSVIIPTYKRASFLVRAIESVLNQEYGNVEIIVVDDNGKGKQQEKTKAIVLKYKTIKIETYERNRGACFARNKGAEVAQGDILMFLDDDDYYLEGKVSKQLKVFEDDTLDACLCAMIRVDENKDEIVSRENIPRGTDLKTSILDGNCFTSMIAIRKSVFIKLGGFSEISRFQDKYFMYKFHENKLNVKLIYEQLFVLTEHKKERISLGCISKIDKSVNKIFEFEKVHFDLFNTKEKIYIKNRYFKLMASGRFNENIKERWYGVKYLLRCDWLIKNDFLNKFKILVRLTLSSNWIDKLKLNG